MRLLGAVKTDAHRIWDDFFQIALFLIIDAIASTFRKETK